MKNWVAARVRLVPTLAAIGAAVAIVAVGSVVASDHQDTPLAEFNPQFDVNDVYAFPAATPGRTVLVLGTSSPITPAQTSSRGFGTKNEVLYQLKIDNTGDAVEDLVLQFTFTGNAKNQRVSMQGPAAPVRTGTMSVLINGKKDLAGPTGQILGSASDVQLFAGPREDPFFIDLEQFFRIIPDRKPESGPLSLIPETPTASSFREPGAAIDYLRGINDLAIVVELPTAMLTNNGLNPRFGVWGTTSRRR